MKSEEGDTALLERLRALRWKEGVRCPRCAGADCALHMRSGAAGRRKFLCYGCGRTFNDLTATPFARTHVALSAWRDAARLTADGEPTCAQVARRLNVKLATAWRIRRVIRRALAEPLWRQLFLEEGV